MYLYVVMKNLPGLIVGAAMLITGVQLIAANPQHLRQDFGPAVQRVTELGQRAQNQLMRPGQ
jgi:hypothetical protein